MELLVLVGMFVALAGIVLFSLFVAYALSGYVMWLVKILGRKSAPPAT